MKWLKLISAITLILSVGQSQAQSRGKIAFLANYDHSDYTSNDIYIMDTDGGNVQRLTYLEMRPGGDSPAMSWSPDGTRIAFTHQNQVQILAVNDGSIVQLTEGYVKNQHPSWSRDGARIAFSSRDRSAPVASRQDDIFVMNSDGANPVNLTNTASQHELFPSWSPDGSRIVYLAQPFDGPKNIFVMNADGSNPIQLTDDPADKFLPKFSPDGSKIAYTKRDGSMDIIVMNADGSNPVNLTNTAWNDVFEDWSPDGSKILLTSGRKFEGYDFWYWNIFMMDADGSNDVPLTRKTQDSSLVSAPIWSPLSLPTAITPASWGQVKWEFR